MVEVVFIGTPSSCHGRAGSQQPTEPALHATVQREQHVEVMKPGRGLTQKVETSTQHSLQAPVHVGESLQQVSSEEHMMSLQTPPLAAASAGRTTMVSAVWRRLAGSG
tara:strand:- start:43 stop:366 length:324 start_codon:yes stop_codon:yes gene_type:complete